MRYSPVLKVTLGVLMIVGATAYSTYREFSQKRGYTLTSFDMEVERFHLVTDEINGVNELEDSIIYIYTPLDCVPGEKQRNQWQEVIDEFTSVRMAGLIIVNHKKTAERLFVRIQ